MHETTQEMNYLIFWKRFAAALIDGIILNTGFGLLLTILTNVVGKVNLRDFDTGTCEVILGLVYFATLDSLPKQVSVGKKIVEIIFNDLKNKLFLIKETKEYFARLISIVIVGALHQFVSAIAFSKTKARLENKSIG